MSTRVYVMCLYIRGLARTTVEIVASTAAEASRQAQEIQDRINRNGGVMP